ncbi:mitochondrial zinc maintenance protein 1, mitochondrial [Saccharata proteae CBS 121410]|uniref:Mitochondrial zinc maintenance protein 1, mitochondrial n=1 Tax=Saccharata proteae CBS 121410 TaxID=1314787 RepID=A0A9P4HW33_9PEZI|nr:mitochondrial zinc maintenance protein 1, mitochondrial [Saccharata proteae CBS 121410]
MSLSRELAISAYRNLLRSTRIAFHGDVATLNAARAEVHKQFVAKRSLEPGSQESMDSLAYAAEVSKILRQNVVQGEQDRPGHYKLNIHEHTERGDNDSIKKGKGRNLKVNSLTGKCSDA